MLGRKERKGGVLAARATAAPLPRLRTHLTHTARAAHAAVPRRAGSAMSGLSNGQYTRVPGVPAHRIRDRAYGTGRPHMRHPLKSTPRHVLCITENTTRVIIQPPGRACCLHYFSIAECEVCSEGFINPVAFSSFL